MAPVTLWMVGYDSKGQCASHNLEASSGSQVPKASGSWVPKAQIWSYLGHIC